MGGGSTKTVETQGRQIPGLLRPYLKDLLGRGKTASGEVSSTPYTGGFNAQPLGLEYGAAANQAQVGQNLGINSGQGVIDLGQKQASGYFLNPETNPYLQPQIQATTDQIYRNYADQSNRTASQSIQQGAYGGSRGGIEQAILAGNTNRAIGDTTANLLYGNYAAERANQQNSGALIQQGAGLNLLGPEIVAQGGANTRALNQIGLDEALAQFNENNAAPFRPLEPYANLIYGSPSVFANTGAVSKTSGGSSTWGNIISLLLGGGSVAGSFLGGGA